MSGRGRRSYDCFRCPKRVKPKDRFTISRQHRQILSRVTGRYPSDNDYLCNKCRHFCRSAVKRKGEMQSPAMQVVQAHQREDDRTPVSPPSVNLPFPSTSRGHASCCICKRPGPKLVVVPLKMSHRIFIMREIIIPAGSRCCPNHLLSNFDNIVPLADTVMLNKSTITNLIKFMREEVLRQEKTRLDFENSESLSDSEYIDLLGISKDSFVDMLKYLDGRMRCTPARSVRTSLAIFLMKLRSGESIKILSTLFNVSKSSIRRCVKSVRSALVSGTFIQENLGFQHITRETVIREHTRKIAQTIFGDVTGSQAILVLDGTYIYINKSGNFKFQRQSYSLHKNRPLVKPMVIVSTSGYFVSVIGPYFARNNDASILTHIMKTNIEDVRNWVQEDDVFIVDRGFRDAVTYLEHLGIKAEMPAFMEKGETQMSTESANTSRLVTKIRWVVESANSRIKHWKYLSRVLPTNQIPFVGDYIRIVCAICNRYLKPLSKGSADEDEVLGCRMLYMSKQANELKEYVENNHLDRRTACWTTLDEIDFPRMDEDQLRTLTCGIYQLRLSSCYAREHLDGDCTIQVHKEETGLLRARLQSRHVSSKMYQLWIRYDTLNINGWYCKCRAGARVVGMCAHVAAIVWYLAYGRHICASSEIGVRNWGQYLEDSSEIPLQVDESDPDESSGPSDIEE